jgi:hypothetical protein
MGPVQWEVHSAIQEALTLAPPETPAGKRYVPAAVAMVSHVLGVRTFGHYTNHHTSSTEVLVDLTGIRPYVLSCPV